MSLQAETATTKSTTQPAFSSVEPDKPGEGDSSASLSEPTVAIKKQAVERKYSQDSFDLVGERANNIASGSCCCSPSIPSSAGELSLGCGSPVSHLPSTLCGVTLVDLGSGGGIDVFAAANRLGGSSRIIGVDSTAKMVARARRAAEENHYSNVEFRLGEIERMPVADSSADVVTSNCALNLVPDKSRAFKEIYRVLKPGGFLTVSDVVSKRPLPERVRSDPAKWSECVSGALSLEQLGRGLSEAGFVGFRLLEEGPWDKTDDPGVELSSVTFYAEKPKV
jgi:arsenite methyltransferase